MHKNSQSHKGLHGWIVCLVLLLGLAIVSTSCASIVSRSAPSPISAVEACDAGKVTVTGVHWFRERSGAWRVVGVINNGSTKVVSKVVTGVETYDKAGQPADQGEDVSSYPLDLQPGAQAPFTAWIDREIPNLDHFEVEVDECVLAEPAERSQVEVRAGKARLVTSEMFADQIMNAAAEAEIHGNSAPSPVTGGEVDEWLKLFGADNELDKQDQSDLTKL